MAACLSVIVSIGAMGVIEMIASHRVISSLGGRIDEISAGSSAAAFDELRRVSAEYGWTLAGRRAARLSSRLFILQLEQFERQFPVPPLA